MIGIAVLESMTILTSEMYLSFSRTFRRVHSLLTFGGGEPMLTSPVACMPPGELVMFWTTLLSTFLSETLFSPLSEVARLVGKLAVVGWWALSFLMDTPPARDSDGTAGGFAGLGIVTGNLMPFQCQVLDRGLGERPLRAGANLRLLGPILSLDALAQLPPGLQAPGAPAGDEATLPINSAADIYRRFDTMWPGRSESTSVISPLQAP